MSNKQKRTGPIFPKKMEPTIDISTEDVNIEIGKRLDFLATNDPQYQRLMGMRDILLKLEGPNVPVQDNEVSATGGADTGGDTSEEGDS